MTFTSSSGKTLEVLYDEAADTLTVAGREFAADYFRAKFEAPVMSHQQRTVLELLTSGKRNKEIAGIMNLDERTVHSHKRALMARLKITNNADLIKLGLQLTEST